MATVHRSPDRDGATRELTRLLASLATGANDWPPTHLLRVGSPDEAADVIEAVTDLEPRDRVRAIIGVGEDHWPVGMSESDVERAADVLADLVGDIGTRGVHYDVQVTRYNLDDRDLDRLRDALPEDDDEDEYEDGEEEADEFDEDGDEDDQDEDDDEDEDEEAQVAVVEIARRKAGRVTAAA